MVERFADNPTEQDYRALESSWIPRELVDYAGIRRVSSNQGAQIVGRNGQGDYAGLIFPYVWPGESKARDYRLRRDHPELESKPDGTTRPRQKYLSPPGRRNLLYFPPGIDPALLTDARLPVILLEGEKKTLAVWQLAKWHSLEPRFLPVGLSGVWNWRGTIGREPDADGTRRPVKGPIPDLDHLVWQSRRTVILFDSDARRNFDVGRATKALSAELAGRGAEVFIVELPDLPGLEKTGADDFLAHAAGGPDHLLKLIENAARVEPFSAAEILDRAGIPLLTALSGIKEVEAALRYLRAEAAGADSLCEAALRAEAIKHLKAIGVYAPAQMVHAALRRADQIGETQGIVLAEPELWPHPVNGAAVLDDVANALCRFLVMPLAEIGAISLWILHTYAIDALQVSPLLIITSAEKRCGKTLLLDLLLNLVLRPLPTANITASALFRTIEKCKPTLLIDEADTFLHNSDELRGIINSGHRRPCAYVIRTVGDEFEPRQFKTFGPKAIAQIGMPAATIVDRGIVIEMRRKKPEDRPERLRSDRIFDELAPLRRKLMRWATDNLENLRASDPDVPAELNDRAQDSWRPLLAIADLAGGKSWPGFGRESALKLCGEREEASYRVLLLSDVRTAFKEAQADRMTSGQICEYLQKMEERPWPEWRDGKPITPRQLARLLEPFGMRPRQMKIGSDNVRGYELEQFTEAFSRYVPISHSLFPQSSRQPTWADETEDGPGPEHPGRPGEEEL